MRYFVHARLGSNRTVHLFEGNACTPLCGSGNTRNVNLRILRRVYPTSDEVTCKKCRSILYR